MSELNLQKARIRPEVMVYGVKKLPVVPQFADFTFTPKGIRSVESDTSRNKFVKACLVRGVHPTGQLIYTNTNGDNFIETREIAVPPPTETQKATIMRLELRGNWDPAKIIVRLPRTLSTSQAFRRFKSRFMEEVMGMGKEGYVLTGAEICIVSVPVTPGSFSTETGVQYQADTHPPFFKLVIGERTRSHSVAQRCVEPMQSWFEDLKVNPKLPTTNP